MLGLGLGVVVVVLSLHIMPQGGIEIQKDVLVKNGLAHYSTTSGQFILHLDKYRGREGE